MTSSSSPKRRRSLPSASITSGMFRGRHRIRHDRSDIIRATNRERTSQEAGQQENSRFATTVLFHWSDFNRICPLLAIFSPLLPLLPSCERPASAFPNPSSPFRPLFFRVSVRYFASLHVNE